MYNKDIKLKDFTSIFICCILCYLTTTTTTITIFIMSESMQQMNDVQNPMLLPPPPPPANTSSYCEKKYYFKFTNTNDTFSLYFPTNLKKRNFMNFMKLFLRNYYNIKSFEIIEAGLLLNENEPSIPLNTDVEKTLYELFYENNAFYIRPHNIQDNSDNEMNYFL